MLKIRFLCSCACRVDQDGQHIKHRRKDRDDARAFVWRNTRFVNNISVSMYHYSNVDIYCDELIKNQRANPISIRKEEGVFAKKKITDLNG